MRERRIAQRMLLWIAVFSILAGLLSVGPGRAAALTGPTIIAPAGGDHFRSSDAITVQWYPVIGAVSYQVVLLDERTTESILRSAGNATSYVIPAGTLKSDRYYSIRITALDSANGNATGPTVRIFVDTSLEQQPVITAPAAGAQVDVGALPVTWKPVDGAIGYHLYITEAGKEVYKALNLTQPSHTVPVGALQGGHTYELKVMALDKDRTATPSEPVVFAVMLGKPVISTPRANDSLRAGDVTVSWASVPGTNYYLLVAWDETAKTQMAFETVYGTSYTLKGLPPNGRYRVAVAGRTGDFTRWSTEVSFRTVVNDVEPPTITSPTVSNTPLPYGPVTVKWNAVSGATGYRVILTDAVHEVNRVETPATSYEIPKSLLLQGKEYQVSVVALQGDKEASSTVIFRVEGQFGVSLLPPEITAPAKGSEVPYAPVTVAWNSVANATSYRVTLSKGTMELLRVNAPGNATSLSLEKASFQPGVWYRATVTAVNGSQEASSPVTFRIAGGLTMPPTITFPLDNAALPFGAFTVEWLGVPDASGYRVELAELSKGVKLMTSTTAATSYKVVESLLASGKQYRVSVTALGTGGQEATTSIIVRVGDPPRVDAPVITAPTAGQQVPRADLTLRWNAVSGAAGYRVVLTNATTGKTVSEITSFTQLTVAGSKLDWGKQYTAAVTAIAQSAEATSSVAFKVEPQVEPLPPEGLVAPTILTPVGGAKVPLGSIAVRWSAVKGATGYRIRLREAGSTAIIVESLVDGTGFTFGEGRFQVGHSYQVEVTALASGQEKSSVVTFSLTRAVAIEPPGTYTAAAGQIAGERMMALHVLKGKSESDPLALDDQITRAELVTIIVRAFGREPEAVLLNGTAAFPDSRAHWASGYVAMGKKIVEQAGSDPIGLPDGSFDPDGLLTPPQAVAFLMKFLGVRRDTNFTWPYDFLNRAAEVGIVQPADKDLIARMGESPATRGLVFYLLDRAFYDYDLGQGKTFYTRYVDPAVPVLTLNDLVLTSTTVTVSGSVEGADEVTVNGNKVVVDVLGQFSVTAPLPGGGASFTAVARDLAGNVSEKSVKLTR